MTAATGNHYLPEWSEADLAKVASMLRAGDGARTIAEAMDVTRATVIGRVSRRPALKAIGFKTMNGLDIRKSRAATNYYAETKAAKPRRAAPQHFEEPVLGDGVSLMDLKPSACKWPSSADPVVFCCKAKREPGKPYCRNHLIRAYRSEVA